MDEPRIVIVTFDGAQILDVTGPLEVFSSASRHLPGVRYSTQVASPRGGAVRASCGLDFDTVALSSVQAPIDTLVVAGGSGSDVAGTERRPAGACSSACC